VFANLAVTNDAAGPPSAGQSVFGQVNHSGAGTTPGIDWEIVANGVVVDSGSTVLPPDDYLYVGGGHDAILGEVLVFRVKQQTEGDVCAWQESPSVEVGL
jgi:hypothetical protein